MLALLVFLICAMVGSVVLASATAAAGRIKGIKEDDQTLYTLTSSAQMFADEIGKMTCDYQVATGETVPTPTITPADAALKSLMDNLVKDLGNEKAMNLSFADKSFDNTALKDKAVTAKAKMELNYDLVITLSIEGDSTSPVVTLKMDGVPYENIAPSATPSYGRYNGSDNTAYPLYVTWNNPVITVGGAQ